MNTHLDSLGSAANQTKAQYEILRAAIPDATEVLTETIRK